MPREIPEMLSRQPNSSLELSEEVCRACKALTLGKILFAESR